MEHGTECVLYGEKHLGDTAGLGAHELNFFLLKCKKKISMEKIFVFWWLFLNIKIEN